MVAGQIRKCVVEPDASITDVSSDSAFECGSYFGELEHLTVSHGALYIILLCICSCKLIIVVWGGRAAFYLPWYTTSKHHKLLITHCLRSKVRAILFMLPWFFV